MLTHIRRCWLTHTHSLDSYTGCRIMKAENSASIKKCKLCVMDALRMCHCHWWHIRLNNHLQSYLGIRQLSWTRPWMNTDGWDSDCFPLLSWNSTTAKLSRRVPNHSGRVPFYTDAFRTVSAGVANADSALPYLNGTSTQDIINAEFMKEHKKTV